MLKRLVLFLTVFCIGVSVCSSGLTASAAVVKKGKITVATVSAITGDEVIVPIVMTENPGIMAITVSITYDSDALKFVSFFRGDIVKDYTVVAHPDKNIIRFVNCESKDRTNDGELINLKFRVKDNAEADLHPISIHYSAGDFCNWQLDKIMPEIVPGGIDVAFNGNNCSHKKYDPWTVAAKPSCEEKGADQRICKTCGHVELRDTDPIGHEYSDQWTVDQPATAQQDGIMTRYCIRCDDFVDRITFTLEQSEEGNIKNEINADVPVDKFTEEIFKEQYPDKELTDFKPSSNKENGNDKTDQNTADDTDSADKTDTVEDGSDAPKQDADSGENKGSLSQIIESIAPEVENPDGAKVSVLDKISEVFPKSETIINIFEIALIILAILVL